LQVNSEERLIIEITDFGIPFNPLLQEAPQVTDDISERKVGGLGVYFIKTVMDEVYYRREGDKNILTLVVYKK
jgi:anti-sigma regulatory factor (Ser/Thr protein kinase)